MTWMVKTMAASRFSEIFQGISTGEWVILSQGQLWKDRFKTSAMTAAFIAVLAIAHSMVSDAATPSIVMAQACTAEFEDAGGNKVWKTGTIVAQPDKLAAALCDPMVPCQ
jgi:hypothetical protein